MGKRRTEITIPQVPRVTSYNLIDAEVEFFNVM